MTRVGELTSGRSAHRTLVQSGADCSIAAPARHWRQLERPPLVQLAMRFEKRLLDQTTFITGVECNFTSEQCDPGGKWFEAEPTSTKYWEVVKEGDCP